MPNNMNTFNKGRFFVMNSSMFDKAFVYDIDAMKGHLAGMISKPRACFRNGWNNQPKVLTFELKPGITASAVANKLSKLFEGRVPIVTEKNW